MFLVFGPFNTKETRCPDGRRLKSLEGDADEKGPGTSEMGVGRARSKK